MVFVVLKDTPSTFFEQSSKIKGGTHTPRGESMGFVELVTERFTCVGREYEHLSYKYIYHEVTTE